MLVVVAVGNDVLRPAGEDVAAPEQQAAADEVAGAPAALAAQHHLVLACGWGSHAGLPSLDDIAGGGVPTYPLEVLDSEAECSAAHRFEQEVARRLPPDRLATVVVARVVSTPTTPPSSARRRRRSSLRLPGGGASGAGPRLGDGA
jgi:carbamate kinase